MFTRCSFCHAVLALGAAQLSAGRGRVRCGQCKQTFDALAHLSDGLPEDVAEEVPTQLRLRTDEHRPLVPREPAPAQARPAANEMPTPLREERARARGRGLLATTTLIGLAVILSLALVAQYAWSRTATLVEAYPQSRDLITRICRSFGCELPITRDPSKMRIVARDVRLHPRYEGALLVTASMENKALVAQPYPRLEFSLYDINGQSIARRVFEPKEYIDAPRALHSPLQPLQPLQIGFELLAPEEEIISFEFRFL